MKTIASILVTAIALCGCAAEVEEPTPEPAVITDAAAEAETAPMRCASGEYMCAGANGTSCVDPYRDANNCGRCGKRCDGACVAGQCR